jgi:uncharacterized protein involved in type VI secretion and phage assembly
MDTLAELLQRYGIEYFKRFYGVYRGLVEDNQDPEKRGRVRVRVPLLGNLAAPPVWIDSSFSFAGRGFGSFEVPEVGSAVWVAYEVGNPRTPVVYWGGWHGEGFVPPELAPVADLTPWRRGFVTRMGHVFAFDDEPGKESITIQWHQPDPGDAALKATNPRVAADRTKGKTASIKLQSDGSILVTDAHGSSVHMDASGEKVVVKAAGNTVTLDSSGATVDSPAVVLGQGADTPAVRGRDLVQYLLTHTHLTSWGPSGPPITPPPASILSTRVTLK